MSSVQKIVTTVLLALLTATAYGWWSTSQPAGGAAKPGRMIKPADKATGIDESLYATAQHLAPMAEGPDEQALAQNALRFADRELDLSFTAALHRIEAHPPALSPEAQAIQEQLQKSQKLVGADQAAVTRLTAALAQAGETAKGSLQDQLDLATSQLELDKDEVDEANQDLLQAGGNLHQRIQMMMQEHESGHGHSAVGTATPAAATASAAASAGPQGLVRRIKQWRALRSKQEWLVYAGSQALATAGRLTTTHEKLATQLETSKADVPELMHHTKSARAASVPLGQGGARATADAARPAAARDATYTDSAVDARVPAGAVATPAGSGTTPPGAVGAGAAGKPTSLLNVTRQIAADQKRLTLMDQRVAALRQLEAVYRDWKAATSAQIQSIAHSMLSSIAVVLIIILVLLFVDRWLEHLLVRTKLDRRQIETLRSVSRVALQILGIVIILLIVIGLPSDLGTMIGLAGAGLTVALKDFIVAFIGWLVLMGRNGVRLGDWVEINGVSGEVVELGMFHTVLLETGNWTDAGHPTGRRVTFTNSFAIEGHYFNFSTSGQWLWDELLVLVPFDKDPSAIAEAIHKEVVSETADSAKQAEEEWRRSGPTRRGTVFAATPGISVRPAVGGVEVAVRYITRASERFQLRSRLFQSAVRLLANHPRAQAT